VSDTAPSAIDPRRWDLRSGLGRFALGLCLVALLQSAVLAWMVYDRITLIRSGKEIVLDIVPVDPRSLFRGDYVILNYPVSRIDRDVPGGGQVFRSGDTIFVTLKRSEAKDTAPAGRAGWSVAAVSKDYPDNISPEQIVLRGRVRHSGRPMTVRYGVESYFVPEGEGKSLENAVRERKLQVLVAVATDGEAAIKALLVDGELQYEEPLF
jgi:uncharacterized membrane-anchored protein